MEPTEACDTHEQSVDLSHPRNLRFTPHPISEDPRLRPNEQGYEHGQIFGNFAARIPDIYTGMFATNGENGHENARMKCCCGRSDCAYLEHNNAALGGLERDLETAARLGQALLTRHESYINESQAERARLSTSITELESERTSLQDANEKIVAENRELLQKLEHLNGNLADSDRDVKRLENLLLDCELEVKRLNGLVRRTEELDGRVQEMERERQTLTRQMEDGKAETRSTLVRWKESERRVRELEEDVRRIEWEARVDREKHEEIVARLEKENSLERELGGAEGRLKGAAALQNLGKISGDSKNVVSHFVRDILQDNANLQAGIAELRELLQSSNEEVQNLREQIMLHQPVVDIDDEGDKRKSVSLDHELQSDTATPKQLQQEVHVHHHYHAKPTKSRTTTPRRQSKRKIVTSGLNITSDSSVPSTPVPRPQRHASSPIIPFSLHHTNSQKNRWSMQSTATTATVLSSIPSSPRSYFDRGGSLFDRPEHGEDSSRPTSPESMGDLLSPGPSQWRMKKEPGLFPCEEEDDRKEDAFVMSPLVDSKSAFDANHLSAPLPDVEKDLTPKPSLIFQPQAETNASVVNIPEPRPPDDTPTSFEDEPVGSETPKALLNQASVIRPSLNRKGSHETLVSISGMDIHIAQRPSPTTTLELLHRHFAHRPTQTHKLSPAQPLASVTEYTAVPSTISVCQTDKGDSRNVPASIEALSGIAIPRPKASRTSSQPGAIGRLGGWVRGKWGVAPMKSTGNLRTVSFGQESVRSDASSSSTSGERSDITGDAVESNVEVLQRTPPVPVLNRTVSDLQHSNVDPSILFGGRSPGINQPGFIPGFRSAVMNRRTPSQVMVSVIDEEGLKQSLAE